MSVTVKKLLSVFLAFVLVFAFTPTVALGEGAGAGEEESVEPQGETLQEEAPEASDVQPATFDDVQDIQSEPDDSPGTAAFTDDSFGAEEPAVATAAVDPEPELTTQATVNYYEADGYRLGYVQHTYTPAGESGAITGAVITDVNVGNAKQYDVVIPQQVTHDEITLNVIGLGSVPDRGFNFTNAGHVDTLTFPAGIRFVTDIAFGSNVQKSVVFEAHSNVTKLSTNMFEQFWGTSVTLPDSLVEVPSSMFHYSNIEQIALPDSVLQINREAFYGAYKLEGVALNNGLLVIGEEAFASEPFGGSYTYGRMLPLTYIAIPGSVTDIQQQAFAKDQKLTSLTFGVNSQLATIGSQAFYGTSLTSVDIPDSVTSIGAEAFSGGNGNANIGDDTNPNTRGAYTLTSVNLGTSQDASRLTTLGSKAFAHQPITSVTLPNSLTSLGYDTSTYTLTMNNGWSNGLNGTLGAFSGCDKLEAITWPTTSTMTAIGGFDGCSSLTSEAVNSLPSWVKTIDKYAFYNCTSLSDVRVPESVTKIGQGAFGKATQVAFQNGAPTYTLLNKDVDIEWDASNIATTSPWPLACGVTVKYPFNAESGADIRTYRAAVEAYETAQNVPDDNKTKFVETADEFFTVTGKVPEGATVTLYAGSDVRQPTLDSTNSFSELVEGGKYVGAVVSLDGYKDYSISPVNGQGVATITGDWTFTVAKSDMTPLSQLGILQVTASGPYKADCNIAVFEKKADGTAGKLVSQGQALLASHSPADSAPAYVVDDIAAGDYIVVAWQANDYFKRISSIGDFAAMGFNESDYARQDVTITPRETETITLAIPPLDTTKIASVLATGEVYVANLYNPPSVPFVLYVKYNMTTGQNVDSVRVNIPEGLEPVAAATNAKDYGVDGSNGGTWNAANHVLTISGLADEDKQSGTISIALKATEAGSYAVSASLTSGSIAGPIGSTMVEVPAVKLIVPEGSLQSREFTVHVYAKPSTAVTLKIGDTTLDGTYTTNLLGHVKAKVKIPDEEISSVTYYLVTASVPAETEGGDPLSDTAVVEYNAVFDDLPLQPTIHDFSFDSAGDTVYLAKNGEDLSGGYYILGVHQENFTREMPFTVAIDSLQPLDDEVGLYLGMLDNSVVQHTAHLTGTTELKSGAKRYVYQTIVPVTENDEFKAKNIPCRFDVAVTPLALATGESGGSVTQPEWSQANMKALNLSVKAQSQALFNSGRTAFQQFYDGLSDTNKSLIDGKFFFSDSYLNTPNHVDYEKIENYDFALGVFNNSFRHTTWDPDNKVWNTLTSAQKSQLESYENQVANACDFLAIVMGNNKPLYEYESFEAYAKAEYGFDANQSYSPDELKQQGYTVIYDDDADLDWGRYKNVTYDFTTDTEGHKQVDIDSVRGVPADTPSGSAWYAVNLSDQSTPVTAQSAIELTVMDSGGEGGSAQSTVSSWWGDFHRFIVRMGTDEMDDGTYNTVSAGLVDLTSSVASTLPEEVYGFVGKGACSVAGLIMTAKSTHDSFNSLASVKRELTTRENELERMKSMVQYYKDHPTPDGKNSKCQEALEQEIKYMNDYISDLKKQYWISGASTWIGGVAGGVSNGANLAAQGLFWRGNYLAATGGEAGVVAAGEFWGAATMCEGVALAATAVGVVNTAGSLGAGALLTPNINDHKAIVDNFRFKREYECKKTDFGKLHYFKKPIMDPSGYTYEGVESTRVEGVTATIYQKATDATGAESWKTWDAENYDQTNPQTTTADGLYAWDVPEGDWKVLFQKEGYDDVWSQVMHVLPEWTNVGINMLRSAAPAGVDAALNADDEDAPYVDITFDQLMQTGSDSVPTVTVGGVTVAGATWVDATTGRNAAGDEVQLARVLRVPLASLATPGEPVEVVVSDAVSYAGKAMAAPYKATVTVPAPEYYYVTPSDVATFTKGSGEDAAFTFKRSPNDDRTFGKFTGILVDGKEVDAANYTAVAGSVVVTLKAAYLETLSEGAHVLTAQFADGSATADFTVNAAPVEPAATKGSSVRPATKAPATGDRLVPTGALLAAACAAAAVALFASRRLRPTAPQGKHARR